MHLHEHADHEAHRLRRADLVGKTVRQLVVDPDPVDPVGQGDMFQADDLVEANPAKVVMRRFLLLFGRICPPNGRPLGNHNWTKN